MGKLKLVTKTCAVLLLWAATAIALPAQTFTLLHNFDYSDGYQPVAGLFQGADGNLYGSTFYGGAGSCSANGIGCGTIFRITPNGTLTTLLNFNYGDGASPAGNLIQATDGKFYGTATDGGAHDEGTVFSISGRGTLTTLYSFCSQDNCTDGTGPLAGLVQGIDGNFYGATLGGGSSNNGTVFKITPNGTLATLHRFNGTDGAGPFADLILGTDGNFYGTTEVGGVSGCGFNQEGCGTVFKITPNGTLTTLHIFNGTDGSLPEGALVQGADGNFYGTTFLGGTNHEQYLCDNQAQDYELGCGTIFRITPSGTLTTIYNFCSQSGCTDGANPYGGLIQATDGNLYGTTVLGGAGGDGTIFIITSNSAPTTLHSFDGKGDAADGGLIQGTDGSFTGRQPLAGPTAMARCLVCPSAWGRLWRQILPPAKWERRSGFWEPISLARLPLHSMASLLNSKSFRLP